MFRYIFPKSALNSLLNAMQYTIQWNSDYNRERERERSFSSSIVCQRVWLQFWIECDLKWLLFTFYSQKHDMNWEKKFYSNTSLVMNENLWVLFGEEKPRIQFRLSFGEKMNFTLSFGHFFDSKTSFVELKHICFCHTIDSKMFSYA
jgi:hypothetical protein